MDNSLRNTVGSPAPEGYKGHTPVYAEFRDPATGMTQWLKVKGGVLFTRTTPKLLSKKAKRRLKNSK